MVPESYEDPLAAKDARRLTTAFVDRGAPKRQVMFVPGGCTAPHFTHEVSCLLRRRLRVAGLISFVVFGAFLVRAFFHLGGPLNPHPIGLLLHSLVVAILAFTGALLWSSIALTMRTLRWIEAAMFGPMAVFFAFLHFSVFYHNELLDLAKDEDGRRVMYLFVNVSNCLRWFALIILYGTFIPNTWRRCAVVVGGMALVPIALSLIIGCGDCPVLGAYVWHGLFEMIAILFFGSAVAIFGSYKISELEQKAFEGRQLGQYFLQRRLGAGGMGEVYLAQHTMLRRACAIKLIRPDQAGDPTLLSRFEREVQAMANLTHWNTVEIFDYGLAEDGTFFYVMEYLPGLSLQELIERHGPLPPGRAIYILRQLCAALREAHGVGLIHRDIKPSNVILCERGGVGDVAKLLDFGLVQASGIASSPDKLTRHGAILGSPSYISPEQALGKKVDARTDIYSLGGLAYFLVTGHPPYERETTMELLMAHARDALTPPHEWRPEMPPDLEELILRCLNKDPERRFADVAQVDQALADCAVAEDWDQERASEWWRERDRDVEPAAAPIG